MAQCSGSTKKGDRCKRDARGESPFCTIHQDQEIRAREPSDRGEWDNDAIIKAFETAVARKRPMILFAASGGARMQEGILSLMQMPRTTVAIRRLHDAGLPYIVVLTDPTTGGVTASYAMLGDVQIAEPNALIGFAGQRVIQDTIREQLPEGFQRSEYLHEHGMLDMVVPRGEIRETLARTIDYLMTARQAA